MEFVEGKSYITASVDIEMIASMHIERWYRPGLHCVYMRRHREYRSSFPPEKRKHLVSIKLDDSIQHSFWVYEPVIQEICVWNRV